MPKKMLNMNILVFSDDEGIQSREFEKTIENSGNNIKIAVSKILGAKINDLNYNLKVKSLPNLDVARNILRCLNDKIDMARTICHEDESNGSIYNKLRNKIDSELIIIVKLDESSEEISIGRIDINKNRGMTVSCPSRDKLKYIIECIIVDIYLGRALFKMDLIGNMVRRTTSLKLIYNKKCSIFKKYNKNKNISISSGAEYVCFSFMSDYKSDIDDIVSKSHKHWKILLDSFQIEHVLYNQLMGEKDFKKRKNQIKGKLIRYLNDGRYIMAIRVRSKIRLPKKEKNLLDGIFPNRKRIRLYKAEEYHLDMWVLKDLIGRGWVDCFLIEVNGGVLSVVEPGVI